jgi:hypothetical protein
MEQTPCEQQKAKAAHFAVAIVAYNWAQMLNRQPPESCPGDSACTALAIPGRSNLKSGVYEPSRPRPITILGASRGHLSSHLRMLLSVIEQPGQLAYALLVTNDD